MLKTDYNSSTCSFKFGENGWIFNEDFGIILFNNIYAIVLSLLIFSPKFADILIRATVIFAILVRLLHIFLMCPKTSTSFCD